MNARVPLLAAGVLLLLPEAQRVVSTQAPSAPVLLVVNSSSPNPFGAYLAEILRTEGVTSFSTSQLSSVTASQLSTTPLVVLAETPLSASQVTLFSNYVTGGGRLIAMKPDSQLASVLGLTAVGTSMSGGYVGIDTSQPMCSGLTSTTLPFRGNADRYTLAGATRLATLYTDQTTPSPYPAVVRNGTTVTWTFDLARSVAYTRQGNPAFAGMERDGEAPIRTTDIFFDDLDLDRVKLPHADILMRLFTRTIQDLLADAVALPRLWYFPGNKKSLMVITSDTHQPTSASTAQVIAGVEARGGKVSTYVPRWTQTDSGPQFTTWRANGHEFGLHPYAFADGVGLDQGYTTNEDWFALHSLGTPSRTTRNHQIEWQGWAGGAQVEANHGIALDTSFYTWGPSVSYTDTWPNGRKKQAHGFITGSGLPMKFVTETGTIISVYQQVSSIIDEQIVNVGSPYTEALAPADALVISKQQVDDSLASGYSALLTQFHADYYGFGEVQPWADGIMDYAVSKGIPLWDSEHWLNYIEARAATAIGPPTWNAGSKELSFTVAVPAGAEAQSIIVPASYGGGPVSSVTVGGGATSFTTQAINGRQTTFFNVSPIAGGAPRTVIVSYGPAAPNNPPDAVNDSAATPLDTPVVISVLANDSDPDDDTLLVSSVSTPARGSAAITNGGTTVTYTPTTGLCGADSFTYTITDGHGGNDTATVNVTVGCGGGSRTHTTVADFSTCGSILTGTQVTNVNGGEVQLASALTDDFTNATLGSQWAAGTWTGGAYTPTISGGVMSIGGVNGAFVRSTTTQAVARLEARAQFTAAPWEHLGYGALDFAGDRYLMFSTFNQTARLYARSNLGGGEQQTDLGVMPAGFHVYRIERITFPDTTEHVRYFIDNVLKTEHVLTGTVGSLHVYVSHNSGTATPTLDVDTITVSPPYVASGTFDSCTMDAGTSTTWSTATWVATVPGATTLALRTRTSDDGTTWSAWSAQLTTSGSAITSPAGRYIQYRLELSSSSTDASPMIESVTLNFGGGGGPPPPPPPSASLSINDVTLTEGNSGSQNATFTVALSAASSQTVTVAYATSNGTASAGSDYSARSGTLTFTPGALTRTFNVPVTGDLRDEPDETFNATLSNATNATIADATGVGTIIDNDPTPSLTINDISVTEPDSGTRTATFTVTLSAASGRTITVNYTTVNGTATAPGDYAARSGTVTFSPGATSRSINVAIRSNAPLEPAETFSVALSNAVNATIADASGTCTINDF